MGAAAAGVVSGAIAGATMGASLVVEGAGAVTVWRDGQEQGLDVLP